jgi:hypothetical protein
VILGTKRYATPVRGFLAIVAVASVSSSLYSCSRTGLGVLSDEAESEFTVGTDAATDAPPVVLPDGAMPPPPTSTVKPPPPQCVPSEEECNGVDDDCDGDVDEIPAVPCAGGGSRYCVAGRMSECPQRCETCMPGSEVICFISYCTFWGVKTCAADGRGFSACTEGHGVPPECEDTVQRHKNSPELEQCCIDNGYCCADEFDLDDDGNKREMLGRCDEVVCR